MHAVGDLGLDGLAIGRDGDGVLAGDDAAHPIANHSHHLGRDIVGTRTADLIQVLEHCRIRSAVDDIDL